MRAISDFNLEAGTSTLGWRAWIAFRTRVSMSAMGSLVIIFLLPALPASLHHAGDLAVQGELAETETAHAEFTQKGARPAAAPTPVAVPDSQLGRFSPPGFLQLQIFGDFCGGGHGFWFSLLAEGHPHVPQQRQALGIRAGRGGNRNIHSLGFF